MTEQADRALPTRIAQSFETRDQLDGAVGTLRAAGERVLGQGSARRALEGEWLGHALHPMLTDLPIGFWTSAFVLDLGGRRAAGAADLCVALGTLSAVPTVAAGLADWLAMSPGKQRVGVVHAAANAVATALYGASWVSRRRGARARGIALGFAGATVATFGGMLGGHLAFGPAAPRPAEPSDAAAGDAAPSDTAASHAAAAGATPPAVTPAAV